jgi:hypothetical protein
MMALLFSTVRENRELEREAKSLNGLENPLAVRATGQTLVALSVKVARFFLVQNWKNVPNERTK